MCASPRRPPSPRNVPMQGLGATPLQREQLRRPWRPSPLPSRRVVLPVRSLPPRGHCGHRRVAAPALVPMPLAWRSPRSRRWFAGRRCQARLRHVAAWSCAAWGCLRRSPQLGWLAATSSRRRRGTSSWPPCVASVLLRVRHHRQHPRWPCSVASSRGRPPHQWETATRGSASQCSGSSRLTLPAQRRCVASCRTQPTLMWGPLAAVRQSVCGPPWQLLRGRVWGQRGQQQQLQQRPRGVARPAAGAGASCGGSSASEPRSAPEVRRPPLRWPREGWWRFM
mmetsp:Transcript_59801/g.165350  ORF Transcript_59801/g.165350 Transcript_59801/m.165350 type:complete len:281 (-) Transcript_59801:49-891(-)